LLFPRFSSFFSVVQIAYTQKLVGAVASILNAHYVAKH
jgi:hypothetical protein